MEEVSGVKGTGATVLAARNKMSVFEGGVEGSEKVTGGSDESDFEGFAGGAQALIESSQHWIATDGIEGSHLPCTAHADASSGNMALSADLSGRRREDPGAGARFLRLAWPAIVRVA